MRIIPEHEKFVAFAVALKYVCSDESLAAIIERAGKKQNCSCESMVSVYMEYIIDRANNKAQEALRIAEQYTDAEITTITRNESND